MSANEVRAMRGKLRETEQKLRYLLDRAVRGRISQKDEKLVQARADYEAACEALVTYARQQRARDGGER